MKKYISVFLILALLLCGGCSSGKSPAQDKKETTIEKLIEEDILNLPSIYSANINRNSYTIDYQQELVGNIYLFSLQNRNINDIFKYNDQIVITGNIRINYSNDIFFITVTEEQYKQIEDASTIKMAVKITDVVPVSTFYAASEYDETDDEPVYAYIDVDQGDHIIKGYCIEICD